MALSKFFCFFASMKNNPRILNAWASYDWANSVYNLTITAALFPVYYASVTSIAFGGDMVQFFGMTIKSSVLYSFAIAFSFLLAGILSPLLSGIADSGGQKKLMMQIFTYIGATACAGLYFFVGKNIEWGIICALIASFGYTGAIVFYNSYLPDIATEDRYDSISAKGYSLGFLGSVVQLAFSIFLIQNYKMFGIADIGEATRISFLIVAVWWVGFAQIAFFVLPKPLPKEHKEKNLMRKGFEELGKVWKSLQKMPNAVLFLVAFFFYCMGAQSIFLLATLFGSEELKLGQDKLIPTILGLQLVGILGAYLFAYISSKKGNKFALLCILSFWLVLGVYGYFVTTETQFYIMAITFGVAMGGYHLSRSTYAKLIPQNTKDSTSYFSFYDVVEKMATAFGPFLYGLIEFVTGSMRNSIIALGVYFLIAIILLSFVKVEAGKESA